MRISNRPTTEISWTHHTFNPWIGCVKVSPGCDNCYAESDAKRRGWATWGKDEPRHKTSVQYWKQPFVWNRQAEQRERVFCASLSDIMEDRRDLDPWREELWPIIEATPNLDWLLLTKRPQCFTKLLPKSWIESPRPNVWLLTTIESAEYLWRTDYLKSCPAVVHGLSMEPLLGPVPTLGEHLDGIDWVIAGGESQRGARPMNPEWVRFIRDCCSQHEVAFHFKQWGEYAPHAGKCYYKGPIPEYRGPDENGLVRIGKKAAGSMLDGREWKQFPEVRHAARSL